MPQVNFKVKGLQDIQNKLNQALRGIEGHTRAGVKDAAILVKSEAQALTSIDTGELISSAFLRTGFEDSAKTKPVALVGYGINKAPYAAAVHEMPASTKWKKPGAENKFLEKAVFRNLSKILNIIIRSTKRRPV